MKIAIIGPGQMEIPPRGWGAVEILIHDYEIELKRLGWDVLVTNSPFRSEILRKINMFNPDFVHCQYDEFIDVLKDIKCPKAITSHFGYLDHVWNHSSYFKNIHSKIIESKDVNIFALSDSIAEIYRGGGVDSNRIYLTPNGVRVENFRTTLTPQFPKRSIYLAKIDFRKRQSLFQKYDCSIDFAGNLCLHTAVQGGFDPNKSDYLGEWTKKDVYERLTDYANLILLSDGEAHPLVCMEALSAGLGLVISEFATANLDLSRSFITVIPEKKINDADYVCRAVEENRKQSLEKRPEILEYAKSFDWKKTVNRYEVIVKELCSKKSNTIPTALAKIDDQKLKLNIAIVTIATGKYFDCFFNDFKETALSKFAPGHSVKIYCFTDHTEQNSEHVEFIRTKYLGWPFDSLLRFHLMKQIMSRLRKHDFVFFLDSDMIVERPIDLSILDYPFVAVVHPGFYEEPELAVYEIDQKSSSFVPAEARKKYFQGCFFGGKTTRFLYLIKVICEKIDSDLILGEIPVWHDESYLNWFFSVHDAHAVSPEYAYPEGSDIKLLPRIIHRKKNHESIRGTDQITGPEATEVIDGFSQESLAKFFRLFYLKSHEKVQRLERRIVVSNSLDSYSFKTLLKSIFLRTGQILKKRLYKLFSRA